MKNQMNFKSCLKKKRKKNRVTQQGSHFSNCFNYSFHPFQVCCHPLLFSSRGPLGNSEFIGLPLVVMNGFQRVPLPPNFKPQAERGKKPVKSEDLCIAKPVDSKVTELFVEKSCQTGNAINNADWNLWFHTASHTCQQIFLFFSNLLNLLMSAHSKVDLIPCPSQRVFCKQWLDTMRTITCEGCKCTPPTTDQIYPLL